MIELNDDDAFVSSIVNALRADRMNAAQPLFLNR
jgi:hypothetical protein